MLKFIKSVHGNVSAADTYFMEGIVRPVGEDIASNDEILRMVDSGHLKIFNSEKEAVNFLFRGISERMLAGEDVSGPVKEKEASTGNSDDELKTTNLKIDENTKK